MIPYQNLVILCIWFYLAGSFMSMLLLYLVMLDDHKITRINRIGMILIGLFFPILCPVLIVGATLQLYFKGSIK